MKKLLSPILALVLTLALALSLALPAMAEGEPEPEVNWDDFTIITQPKDLTIKYGESFTLSVEVNVPDGVAVIYTWWRYSDGSLIDGATGPTLQLSFDEPLYPQASYPYQNATAWYSCTVTPVISNEDDKPVVSRRLYSDYATVTVLPERKKTFGDTLAEIWEGFLAVILFFVVIPSLILHFLVSDWFHGLFS